MGLSSRSVLEDLPLSVVHALVERAYLGKVINTDLLSRGDWFDVSTRRGHDEDDVMSRWLPWKNITRTACHGVTCQSCFFQLSITQYVLERRSSWGYAHVGGRYVA
jgi:hypothetical protein